MTTVKQAGKTQGDQIHSQAVVPPSPKVQKAVSRQLQKRLILLGVPKREASNLTEG